MAKDNAARKKPESKDAATGAIQQVFASPKGKGVDAMERVIHERLRLAIVSALAVNDSLTFIELKRLLETSDGNLSVHARKLEDAKYIQCKKGFEGRVPKTEYRLTEKGRKALERYLEHMESLIRAVRDK
ncbi:MAG: transcriptional regulator [bacterium]|nr:transcriptional regulator [bacterium]